MLPFLLFLCLILPVFGAELARRQRGVNSNGGVLVLHTVARQTIGYESIIGLDDEDSTTPSATPTTSYEITTEPHDATTKQSFVKPAPHTDAEDRPPGATVVRTVGRTITRVTYVVPTANEQEGSPEVATPEAPEPSIVYMPTTVTAFPTSNFPEPSARLTLNIGPFNANPTYYTADPTAYMRTSISSRRPQRETVILDEWDRPVTTMKPAPSLYTIIEDDEENPMSTYKPSPSYRTIVRDEDGNPVSTYTPSPVYKTVIQQGGSVIETIRQSGPNPQAVYSTPEPYQPEVSQVTTREQQQPSITWNVDKTTIVTHRPVTAVVESIWYVETVALVKGGPPILKTSTIAPEVEITYMAQPMIESAVQVTQMPLPMVTEVEVTQTVDEIDTVDVFVAPPSTVTIISERPVEASPLTVIVTSDRPVQGPPATHTAIPNRPPAPKAVTIYSTIKVTTSRYVGVNPTVQPDYTPQATQAAGPYVSESRVYAGSPFYEVIATFSGYNGDDPVSGFLITLTVPPSHDQTMTISFPNWVLSAPATVIYTPPPVTVSPRTEPALSTVLAPLPAPSPPEHPPEFQCFPILGDKPRLGDTDELRMIINEFCYANTGSKRWDPNEFSYGCKNLVEASDDRRVVFGMLHRGVYPSEMDPVSCVGNLTYPLQNCLQGGGHVWGAFEWSLWPVLNNVEGQPSGCQPGESGSGPGQPSHPPRALARRAIRNKLGVMSLLSLGGWSRGDAAQIKTEQQKIAVRTATEVSRPYRQLPVASTTGSRSAGWFWGPRIAKNIATPSASSVLQLPETAANTTLSPAPPSQTTNTTTNLHHPTLAHLFHPLRVPTYDHNGPVSTYTFTMQDRTRSLSYSTTVDEETTATTWTETMATTTTRISPGPVPTTVRTGSGSSTTINGTETISLDGTRTVTEEKHVLGRFRSPCRSDACR